MNRMTGIIAGVIAGGVCAAVWAAIAYYSGYEIGWIAWGIGAAVGFVVGTASGNDAGDGTGYFAVAVAILAILVGKYGSAMMLSSTLSDAMGGASVEQITADVRDDTEELQISFVADSLVRDAEARGVRVDWPAGVEPDFAEAKSDYPREIWKDAASRWDAMDDGQRDDFILQEISYGMSQFEALSPDVTTEIFTSSFGLFDILWFGLAAFSAWRLGAGGFGS